eukprot:160621-Rhodomonas_salina.5
MASINSILCLNSPGAGGPVWGRFSCSKVQVVLGNAMKLLLSRSTTASRLAAQWQYVFCKYNI